MHPMSADRVSLDLVYYPVQVLGPGQRIALWVRGCRLGCPGCMSRDLAPRSSSPPARVDVLVRGLRSLIGKADGLTITGGEPFDQAAPLAALVSALRGLGLGDVLVYSGHTLAELRGMGSAAESLLAVSDVLLDGRYLESRPTRKLWRGSDNQVLHCLTEGAHLRYAPYVDACYPGRRPMQVVADNSERLYVVGIPERDDLDRFETGCRRRGIRLGGGSLHEA